jgi:hypothetical protein
LEFSGVLFRFVVLVFSWAVAGVNAARTRAG